MHLTPLLRRAAIVAVLVVSRALLLPVSANTTQGSLPRGAAFALSAEGQRIPIPLESTEVVLDVKPGLMEAQVIQTFTNHTATALEATYLYPLPDQATVTQFELRYQDRIVRSEVREKAEARAVYEAAKTEGRKTAMLEQKDPALFSTAVANFLPGERVQVSIRFVQPLALSAEAVEVRFPMVTGEKYFPSDATPGDEGNAAPNPGRRNETTMAQNHVYAFDIQIAGIPVQKIASPSHRVRATQTGTAPERFAVSLEQEITLPDRDFVLRIETRPDAGVQSTVVTQRTPTGDYGLVTLFPPRTRPARPVAPQPRDVLFLVDRSGSMQGPRLESARRGLARCLDALAPGDRFQIVIFDNQFSFFRPEWTMVGPDALSEAHRHVRGIEARGGTEMQRALAACLDAFERNDRQQILILLTDGDVGNAASLFNLVEGKIGQVRLFTFGIGAAPNAGLLKQMAELGRGQARFISDDDAVERELTDLFATLDAPVLAQPRIALLDAQGNAMPHLMFPERMPDVFVNRPIQVVYRTTQGAPAAIAIEGTEDSRPVAHRLALQSSVQRGDGLEKEFGRRLFADTGMMLRRAKTDSERDVIRKEMLATALQFQLVTELTSRVAVDDRVSRDPNAALTSEHVQQYRAADQTSMAALGGGDVVTLQAFMISSDLDNGYLTAFSGRRTASRLNSTRLQTTIHRELIEGFAIPASESPLPFVTDPQAGLIAGRPGADAALLDGLPIATVIDPATIDRIDVQWNGPARGEIIQHKATRRNAATLTGRFGSHDFSAVSLRGSVRPAIEDQVSVLSLLSWSKFDHAQTSALLDGEKAFDETRTRLGAQWRDLGGYGNLRLVRGAIEHKLNSGVLIEAAIAWHALKRDDADQFRFGSTTARYDGLGFLNLDLLTAQTSRLADTVAQVQVSDSNWRGRLAHRWSLRARWHRQESEWVTPRDTGINASRRDNHALDFNHRMGHVDERMHIETHAGVQQSRTPHTTDAQRTTWTASVGFDRRLTDAMVMVGSWSREAALPWISTGRWQRTGAGWTAETPATELRRAGHLGLRFEPKTSAWSGTIGAFHENISGHETRDWSWERSTMTPSPIMLDAGEIRVPLSTREVPAFTREGWTGSIVLNPSRSFTANASWSFDWKNEGPYRGGHERALLLARHEIRSGWLKGFVTGVAAHYRTALVFDDGYTLQGGLRTDAMLGYRFRARLRRETLLQLNAINLADRSWQLTRFSPDRGRQLLLTLVQGF